MSLGGELYAIGGRSGSTQVAPLEVYDPATDTWTDLPDLPRARNHLAGYADGAQVCVAGGREPDTSTAIDCFDPAAGTWTDGPVLPQATSGALAAVLGADLIVAGGEPSGETSLVNVVQEWARRPMERRHDASAAPRHRLRPLPGPAVGVRRRDSAWCARHGGVHVVRQHVSAVQTSGTSPSGC